MKECAAPIKGVSPAQRRLVDRAEGAVLLARTDGSCVAATAAAEPLCDALARRDPELRGLLLGAAAGGPVTGRIVFDPESETRRAFEVTVIPQDEDLFLLSARDVTMEDNLTRALLKSRELYKDLMHCSADFGWETDARGVFTYISPGGALGYSPRELYGQFSQAILGLSDAECDNVFAARQAQRGTRIWVRARNGARVLLAVSAVPVHDHHGKWIGARGVARDITREHERDSALRLEQACQALLGKIVIAIRSEAAPEEILRAAAESAAEALRAEVSVLLSRTAREGREIVTPLRGPGDLRATALEVLEEHGKGDSDEVSVQLGVGERHCLSACVAASEHLRAVLVFARDTEAEPWRAHEIELVHGVAGHLALALKQADMLERLEALSRHDDLTGLLNRRALMAELTARLAHHRRHGHPGCLLLIDLDHFKALNDTHGHGAGDAALRALGALLAQETRPGDLAARLGGDEFALWLDETDDAGAVAMATRLLASLDKLRLAAGAPDAKLSMSIGIAPFDRERDHEPDAIIAAADAALYEAKRQGRARYALAAPTSSNGKRKRA